MLTALAARAAAHPWRVVAAALALALAGGALALSLTPSAATDTFVGRSSADYKATQSFYRGFGEEPIEVLVQGNLEQLLLGQNIERLAGLEGCLAGRVPHAALASVGGRNGPCGRLARLGAVKEVIGPGTFINEAALEIDEQLGRQEGQAHKQADAAATAVSREALARGLGSEEARTLGSEARKATLGAYAAEVAALAVQYGLTSAPALNNPEFVEALVFNRAARAGTPKRRFAYLFPSSSSALISARLKAGLSEAERGEAIDLIRRATEMPQWRLDGGRYLVTGEPVIVNDLTVSLSSAIELLLLAVVLVMAAALSLVFRSRPRLAPLAVALIACAITFGALALAGGSLTLGSLAVLPVLVGLAVDYAVQLQSRAEEALREASDAEGGMRAAEAVRRGSALGAPTVAGAALASAGAMLALYLSPVPLVQGFGLLLVAGIAVAFVCALTVGSATFVIFHRPAPPRPAMLGRVAAISRWRALAWLAASWRGARALVQESALAGRFAGAALAGAARRPLAVLGVGALLAALGWGLATQSPVETDLTKLVPQNLASLRALRALEHATGIGGQVDLVLSGRSLTTPRAVQWMSSYESAVLKRFGYDRAAGAAGASSAPSCSEAEICPAFSLPDLFAGAGAGEQTQPGASAAAGGSAAGAGHGHGGHAGHAGQGGQSGGASSAPSLTQEEIDSLLGVIPTYFSQNVISPNHRLATLAFGIRLMPLDRQQRVIETMRSMLHPPPGVHARLAGLAVVAADADAQVASASKRALTLLASLAIAALVLLAVFRGDPRRTLVAIVPVALASGWSGLVLFGTRVPLNPMSASLSILVVAIATEFSVLLSERYREERRAGLAPQEALRRTYRATGAAVAASGVSAIAGFGVLGLSQIRMLQEFGLVTLIDLGVSMVGVLAVLPSVLLAFGEPRRAPSPERGPAGLKAVPGAPVGAPTVRG